MKKTLLCSLGISILSIVCIVLIGLSLLSGRFFPGTYIENVDVSLLKREEAQELFSQKRQDAYHLVIIDKNGNQEDLMTPTFLIFPNRIPFTSCFLWERKRIMI